MTPSGMCLFPRPANPLRQMFLFELQAYRVVLVVGELSQAIRQPQDKENGRIVAHRHAGIALFNLDQSRAADGSALCGDLSRYAPPPSCVPYIVAELAQGTRDGYRKRH